MSTVTAGPAGTARRPRRSAWLIGAALLIPSVALAQAADSNAHRIASDTAPVVTIGGYVDGYYAWGFNRPANFDRAYTT